MIEHAALNQLDREMILAAEWGVAALNVAGIVSPDGWRRQASGGRRKVMVGKSQRPLGGGSLRASLFAVGAAAVLNHDILVIAVRKMLPADRENLFVRFSNECVR